ncbi:MAG TPA: SprT family zinc-dependent metalloprotease [Rickettsiales bacterium]|nr:SprT family zinc-dependent metalloprotease [Rickettsiales bacterium]
MAANIFRKEGYHEVLYGNTSIPFRLNFTDRHTLAIHVYPDMSVVIDAPQDVALALIKSRVLKRARWIRKQQKFFAGLPPALPVRKYISGETFRYLGRQYKLRVEKGIINKVHIERGKLVVYATRIEQQRVKELLDIWYRARAADIFMERFAVCQRLVSKINIQYENRLYLRSMRTRWGTCSKDAKITLNPELVACSKECIDYVIMHELCHLKEHNHNSKFYKLLSSVMPDWEERKYKLEITAERRIL